MNTDTDINAHNATDASGTDVNGTDMSGTGISGIATANTVTKACEERHKEELPDAVKDVREPVPQHRHQRVHQHVKNGATGGCTCGAVRYRLNRNPLFVHCCHCSYCQRETGSAFVINALIEATSLELLQGETYTVNTKSHSGAGQLITRCPDCQIALWSHYGGFKSVVSFIRVGTLDDAADFAPDIHIYTSTRVPFVTLPTNVPSVPEYYRMRDFWPDSSIERYRKAKELENAGHC